MKDAVTITNSFAENQLERVCCNVCGRSDEEYLYTKPGTLTLYPFRLVRCTHDGFLYINPRLNSQAISNLYDRAYYNGEGFDPYVNYADALDKEEATSDCKYPSSEELVKIIEELVPPKARLLDFGCGLGDLVRNAQRHGYEADGFEISEYARQRATNLTGTKVFGSLDEIP